MGVNPLGSWGIGIVHICIGFDVLFSTCRGNDGRNVKFFQMRVGLLGSWDIGIVHTCIELDILSFTQRHQWRTINAAVSHFYHKHFA